MQEQEIDSSLGPGRCSDYAIILGDKVCNSRTPSSLCLDFPPAREIIIHDECDGYRCAFSASLAIALLASVGFFDLLCVLGFDLLSLNLLRRRDEAL